MAQLNIRLDEPVKEQAEALLSAYGDPLYNPANIARIHDSIGQFKQGRFVEKSLEELERLADE